MLCTFLALPLDEFSLPTVSEELNFKSKSKLYYLSLRRERESERELINSSLQYNKFCSLESFTMWYEVV